MKLFEVAKVGCFLEGVAHAMEKRRGEDVKVLTLTLRVSPLDSKLATAMPDGVKPTLFKLNSGDPKDTLRRVEFALGMERQLLHVFAAPDTTKATRALDQVRIHATYARVPKGRQIFDFVFRATFGPVGRDELEFVQGWLLTQKFVTFEAAEPGMFDEVVDDDDDEEGTDADQKARTAAQPEPMWDDDDLDGEKPAAAAAPAPEPTRHISKRHPDRKSAAKAKQAGKGKR